MPGDDDKLVRLADVLAALHRAYLDGFNRSAEGYNAEFPFEGDSAENDPFWTDGRDAQVSALVAALPAVTPRPMKDAPRDGTRELIPDADVARVHGFANFGSMTPRQVIVAEGVLKYAYGYSSGHTQLSILLEHGLVRKPKPGSYRTTLTKRGQAYFRAAWPYAEVRALLPHPPEGDSDE
jgi:hypothetical protein